MMDTDTPIPQADLWRDTLSSDDPMFNISGLAFAGDGVFAPSPSSSASIFHSPKSSEATDSTKLWEAITPPTSIVGDENMKGQNLDSHFDNLASKQVYDLAPANLFLPEFKADANSPNEPIFPFPIVPKPPAEEFQVDSPGVEAMQVDEDEATTPKRKGTRRALTVDEWQERRDQHHVMERKRRKLISEQFSKLRELVKAPSSTTQGTVLEAAINTLKKQEKRVKELQELSQSKRIKRESTALVPENPGLVRTPDVPGPVDRFKAFLHSGVAMSVSCIDGHLVDVNESFAKLLKNSKAELTNLSVFTITHSDYIPKTYSMVNNLLTGTKNVVENDYVIVDCKGNPLSVHITTWLVREEGKPKYIVATMVPLEVTPKLTTRKSIHHT